MKRFLIVLVSIVMIIALIAIGYFIYSNYFQEEHTQKGVTTNKKVAIPKDILNNKFGFLSGHPGSENELREMGARWSRPHVGPFVWDSMQKSKDAEISFKQTDLFIKNAQKNKLGTLATIFPFADWDQKTKPNASRFKVSDNDEFLPMNWKKDDKKEDTVPTSNLPNSSQDKEIKDKQKEMKEKSMIEEEIQMYLPNYRGNPANWENYEKWLSALVERYDGDGKNDMENLEIPVKYWEIMNEPDLNYNESEEEMKTEEIEGGSLNFYTEGPKEYTELLIKSYQIIKKADPNAYVVIAGAAGGNNEMLGFYREVFKDKKAIAHFDIANVHCISNDNYESFNVEPYKKMLEEFNISKPIWVTEAESMVFQNIDENATQTLKSTEKAIQLGAEKIFYTRFEFENFDFKPPKGPEPISSIKVEIKGSNPVEAYKIITGLK